MTEQEIIEIALENLKKNALITGEWRKHANKNIDCEVVLKINNDSLKYNGEIKKEVRNHQIYQILALNQLYNPLLLVATHIFPKIKEELRKNKIAYLEANGNIYLHNGDNIIWIDTEKPIKVDKNPGNRAFTKTGLKVLFYFLTDEQNINKTYRLIAEHTGTVIGNITNIIDGLKQDEFILPLTKTEYKFTNKQNLYTKWIAAYDIALKPTLKIGTFRFLKKEDFLNWKNIQLKQGETFWGGEAAGELLTNYLRPEILTLYTTESRTELIKNYKLIPDVQGNVNAYNKFWNNGKEEKNVVPELLAYADLINTGNRRCMETAKKIYDEFLQDKF